MDVHEINDEIQRLEADETTYQNCMKLSTLYIVRDHLQAPEPAMAYSEGASEFLAACYGAEYGKVLNVIDEHMECIKLLYPKEYKAIIKKILQ